MDEPTTQLMERPKHRNQYPPAVTKAKQQRYLQILRETGSHAKSCQAAQIAPVSPFEWATKSALFAKEYEAAKTQGEQVLLKRYESNLDAVLLPDEDMKLDDFARLQNSRFFRMKRLDPAYRDNAVVQVNAAGPVAIQLNFGACTQSTQAPTQDEEKA